MGCRAATDKSKLIRLVVFQGRVVADENARLPGRGAWVHEQCLDGAKRRRAIGRALRHTGEPGPGAG
ncbi:MAG: YlxR family protein [Actinomycetes bacterium]